MLLDRIRRRRGTGRGRAGDCGGRLCRRRCHLTAARHRSGVRPTALREARRRAHWSMAQAGAARTEDISVPRSRAAELMGAPIGRVSAPTRHGHRGLRACRGRQLPPHLRPPLPTIPPRGHVSRSCERTSHQEVLHARWQHQRRARDRPQPSVTTSRARWVRAGWRRCEPSRLHSTRMASSTRARCSPSDCHDEVPPALLGQARVAARWVRVARATQMARQRNWSRPSWRGSSRSASGAAASAVNWPPSPAVMSCTTEWEALTHSPHHSRRDRAEPLAGPSRRLGPPVIASRSPYAAIKACRGAA